MSEQHLRELLDELASDTPQANRHQIDAAWRAAQRRRRRGTALVAASAAGAIVVGATVAISIRAGQVDAPQGGATSSPGSTQAPTAPPESARTLTSPEGPQDPDATYGGAPVWWAPPAEMEPELEFIDSVLPRTIDLSPGQPPVDSGKAALGVFVVYDAETGEPRRFIALTSNGDTVELPADQIEPNRDQNGNAGALTPFNGGLSPDGWHLLVAQPSSIELHDFSSGTWRTIDTPDWLAEGAQWLDTETIWVPDKLGGETGSTYSVDGRVLDRDVSHAAPDIHIDPGDMPYGIWVDAPNAVAGSYFLQGPVSGGYYSNPEAIVARVGESRSVLALDIRGRSKGCCPVVGWVGDDTVAFQSGLRVLAWRVGSPDVYRVSELNGLDDDEATAPASWAWQALR